MAKPQYSKPTSQVDLEERQKKDYVPPAVLTQGEDQPVSENGYIGVDPIYQNFANETEAPFAVEKGPEKEIFEAHLADDVDFSKGATADGEGDEPAKSNEDLADEADGNDSKKSPSATPSGQTPPPTTTAPSNS